MNDVADPTENYRQRRALREKEVAAGERRDSLIAQLRGAVFVGGAVVTFLALRSHFPTGWSAPSITVPVVLFVVLVLLHNRAARTLARAQAGVTFYSDGLDRIDGRWAGLGVPLPESRRSVSGTSGAGPHPYARDLDLFGRASLFELLCRARTRTGQEQLAAWIESYAPVDEARARQQAVAEMRPRVDLREEMARLGQEVAGRWSSSEAARHDADLVTWATAPARLASPLWVVGTAALAVATLVTGALWWVGRWPPLPAILTLAAEAVLFRVARPRLREIEKLLVGALDDLEALAVLLGVIENEPMQAPWLVALRARSQGADGQAASRTVASLRRRTELLLQQRNQFFAPLGFLIGWPLYCAFAVERWRLRHGARLPSFIAAAAELEALLSVASFAYEHPGYAQPVFVGDVEVTAEALAHPLLGAEAVGNDVALSAGGKAPQLLLVSGSNMSGKSTLLRALGTNVVLAQLGAPVRARSFRLGAVRIGASIQVEDSLAAGASRFYAEILRLKQVADLSVADGHGALLFLLDEILAGTNSHDRQIGAAALLRALVAKGAIGLCTTHDLVLTRVVDELGARARNVHFADHVEGQKLVFDYQMRDGVVQRSNALELMRSIGLDV